MIFQKYKNELQKTWTEIELIKITIKELNSKIDSHIYNHQNPKLSEDDLNLLNDLKWKVLKINEAIFQTDKQNRTKLTTFGRKLRGR